MQPRYQALTQIRDGSCFQSSFSSPADWRVWLRAGTHDEIAWSHLIEVSTGDLHQSHYCPGGTSKEYTPEFRDQVSRLTFDEACLVYGISRTMSFQSEQFRRDYNEAKRLGPVIN